MTEALVIPEYIQNIAELLQHSDTMRRPTALELQWYNDFMEGFAERYLIEADK